MFVLISIFTNFPYFFGQIATKSPIVNIKKNVTITTQVGKCEDFVVAWKIDWDQLYGEKKKFKNVQTFIPTSHLC